MADYKIKFEYKGMGQKAAGIRQQVLKSQKGASQKGVSSNDTRSTVSALKTLNNSILKLIDSNKNLAAAMGRGGGGGGGGIPGGGGSGKAFGGIGASIPVLGAGIAALGFAITKINQIGKAYMAKTSQQIGNVGTGGFRRGQGVYDSVQMGAGMKSYAMASGKFSQGVDPNQTALKMGSIYGLSASETLQTAGQFARAGGNYEKAAQIGSGMGIESDLPSLLTGMASIMTDAVREGVNTSNMSEDMAQNLSSLVMATPGKSVEAALNMVKSFQGVQKQVSGGKFGTTEALYTTKASQQMLMEKLTSEEGRLQARSGMGGFLSEQQGAAIAKLGPDATFEDLMAAAPSAAMPLLRKFTAEADSTELQKRTMQLAKQSFGDSPEGAQRFYDFASTQGWSQSQSQLESQWNADYSSAEGAQTRGEANLSAKADEVEGSAAGMSVARTQELENLMFKYGQSFADTTVAMEKSMISIADSAAPGVVAAMEGVGSAMESLTGLIDDLSTSMENAKDAEGNFSFQKMFGIELPWD